MKMLKNPETASRIAMTSWKSMAWIEIAFTSSSELIKKKIMGTNHGAKNELACMITLDHLLSIYINPFFIRCLSFYVLLFTELYP